MIERLVKTIPATNGKLHVISEGRRFVLAKFSGRVEIKEKENLVPILGTVQKGTKSIYASFIVCGDLEYKMEPDNNLIHSGKVYEAIADVNGEQLNFAGLRFEDSDPISNELIFEITDLELIKKFIKY